MSETIEKAEAVLRDLERDGAESKYRIKWILERVWEASLAYAQAGCMPREAVANAVKLYDEFQRVADGSIASATKNSGDSEAEK